MSSYRKGTKLENQVVAFFEAKKGWFANRFTARGDMDVAAWGGEIGFVIECKNKKMTETAAETLYKNMQDRFSRSVLLPVLIYKDKQGNRRVKPHHRSWAFEGFIDE